MSLISSAISTLQSRGLAVLIGAVYYNVLGAFLRDVLGKRFYEKSIHDYRMILDLNDRGISRTLMLFGTREVEHKIMLERVLKPGMRVLDIGANIGYYALMELSLIGEEGELVAVEPSPSNVELLKRNLALNGYNDIEVNMMAISDQPGTRDFFLSEMSNLNTFHDTGTGRLHLSGERVEVQTSTVPELMKGRAPDLIRMDVEGHEVEVVNGLIPAIEKGEMQPMILFETHLSRYSDEHNMAETLRKMFDLGYKTRLVGSSWERGTEIIMSHGYRPASSPIPTDGVTRMLFEDISDDDAISMICSEGGIRTVLLAK